MCKKYHFTWLNIQNMLYSVWGDKMKSYDTKDVKRCLNRCLLVITISTTYWRSEATHRERRWHATKQDTARLSRDFLRDTSSNIKNSKSPLNIKQIWEQGFGSVLFFVALKIGNGASKRELLLESSTAFANTNRELFAKMLQ